MLKFFSSKQKFGTEIRVDRAVPYYLSDIWKRYKMFCYKGHANFEIRVIPHIIAILVEFRIRGQLDDKMEDISLNQDATQDPQSKLMKFC